MVGHLNSKYSLAIRERFLATKTVADVTALMQEFTDAVAAGKHEEQGWPSAAYAVSKSGITGLTRAIALSHQQEHPGSNILINSCCPGFVTTDMTKGRGAKSPDQGAQTPVLLAVGDIKGQTGLFWQHEKPIEW
jgi:carbonyl reductase 1